jgi:hypothetical protein
MRRALALGMAAATRSASTAAAPAAALVPLDDTSAEEARQRLTDPIVQHVVVRADLVNRLQWPVGAIISQGLRALSLCLCLCLSVCPWLCLCLVCLSHSLTHSPPVSLGCACCVVQHAMPAWQRLPPT